MQQTHTTTTHVGDLTAIANDTGFSGIGSIATQPHFVPITRRALMAAVNTLGRDLGLRAASIVVLDALLSCLPCQDAKTGKEAPITPLTLLTVYASNETLCFRAKGITDRQLRRHLDRLELQGLIQRRDSANGKRFPILRSGKVIGAFGLDLSPLLARSAKLIETATAWRAAAQELRGQRACILKLRQDCLALDLGEEDLLRLDAIKRTLRRSTTTLAHAHEMARQLVAILTAHTKPETLANKSDAETSALSASDGQNVRHKKTRHSETTLNQAEVPTWSELATLSMLFPDPPKTVHNLKQTLYDFGRMLRIDGAILSRAISALGLGKLVRIAEDLAAHPDKISNPSGYLAHLIARQVGRGQLLPTS